MNVEEVLVSSDTQVTFEVFKKTNSNPATWQPNLCWELQVESPYRNSEDYQPFSDSNPPQCVGLTNGLTVACNLKSGTLDTLQFQFTEISSDIESFASLRFNFTNFQTPFSAQRFGRIQLKTYGDADCLQISSNSRTISIQGVTIKARSIPASSVTIATTSDEIGNDDPNNALVLSFTPQSKLAPNGRGTINILMPYLYTIGIQNVMPYNPRAFDQCTSDCFVTTTSQLISTQLEINYSNMEDRCMEDTEITVTCRGYYNPIYQDVWDGYSIEIYDSEAMPQLIATSIPTALDAQNYRPVQMPASIMTVEPNEPTVNTESTWTLSLNPSVTLGQECYIKMYFPVDFEYEFQFVEADGIFLPRNRQTVLATSDLILFPPSGSETRQSVVFAGCNEDSSIGTQPFGRAIISQITTQKALFDSDDFGIEIFKDEDLSQQIATLDAGVKVLAQDLSAGFLTNLNLYPIIETVQVSPLHKVEFTNEHTMYKDTRIEIQMPQGLILPPDGEEIRLTAYTYTAQSAVAFVRGDRTVVIDNFVKSDPQPPGTEFVIGMTGIQNQISTKDAGGYTITSFYKKDDQFYIIDTGSRTTSFTAITGLLTADRDLAIDQPVNNLQNVVYQFAYSEDSMVPEGGYIQIDFPSDIQFNKAQMLSTEICAISLCEIVNQGQGLKIKTNARTERETPIEVNVGGFKNARSFKPSGSFQITTYDTDGVALIDVGYNQNVATTIASDITAFSLTRTNTTNGAVNTYTFTLETNAPILVGDVLTFTFPQEIKLNGGNEISECNMLQAGDEFICGVSGSDLQITVAQIVNPNSMRWEITHVKNPASLAPAGSFTDIVIYSQDGYQVASLKSYPTAIVTNTQPALLQDYTLFQDSKQALALNNYTITFQPVNELPATGSFKLTYPPYISLQDGAAATKCFVTTNRLYSENCAINEADRTVLVTGVFQTSAPFSQEITIMLQNVVNPLDNRRYADDGFSLKTYSDAGQVYVADSIDQVLTPLLQCDYPCASCDVNNRSSCTSCWLHTDAIPLQFLMLYPSGEQGTCKAECDYDYTSNGRADKRCQKCDESCADCYDLRKDGDTHECVVCSESYPFRFGDTNLCINTCNAGIFNRPLFQSSENYCAECDLPCLGCFGEKTNCTSCDQQSTKKNLWQNDCIETCPTKTTSVAGVCEPCQSPCDTCEGNAAICTLCDGTDGRQLLLNTTCYADCPLNYANDFLNNVCVGCFPGCDRCNVTNTTQCLRCGENTFLFNDSCRADCPDGYKGIDRVCYWNYGEDLWVLWFPYVVAALLFTVVVLLAKCKKKSILVDGKLKRISNQQSVTAIICFVAPLQFVAVVTQIALGIGFGQFFDGVLAIIVLAVMIIFNTTYFVWYLRAFHSRRPSEIGQIVDYQGQMIQIKDTEMSQQYKVYSDFLFGKWYEKHRLTTWLVLVSSLVFSHKVTKIFYSRFYMFDMFKARWTKVKHLRQKMNGVWFISWLAVDILLIGVSALGLVMYVSNPRPVDQLIVNQLETILLSLYLIVLAIIERCMMPTIFAYTEVDQLDHAEEMKLYNRRKPKKLNMVKLLNKSSNLTFRGMKFEELLLLFGERRCKSMYELSAGWQKDTDPREIKTWPITPQEIEAYNERGLPEFTMDDAFGLQDNVYADALTKQKLKDKKVQGDAMRVELQSALNRKHGNLMSAIDAEQEMLRRAQQNRRRGRKNKYHNQIDIEDEMEVEPEDSEPELRQRELAQIKEEQEQMEQSMRARIGEQTSQIKPSNRAVLDDSRASHLNRQELLENELKMKQRAEAQLVKKQTVVEAHRLRGEELEREKLEAEAEQVLQTHAQKKAEEKEKLERENEKAKQEYEEKLGREREADAEQKREQAREEARLLEAELERMRCEREQKVKEIEQQQLAKDIEKKAEQDKINAAYEQQRQEEKDAANEKLRLERAARREAEESERRALLENELRLQKEIAHKREEAARAEAQRKEQARQEREAQREAEREAREAARSQRQEQAEQELQREKEAQAKQKAEQEAQIEAQRLRHELEVQSTLAAINQTPAPQATSGFRESQNYFQTIDNSDVMSSQVGFNQNALDEFQTENKALITIPPNADLRTFNEHDVLGDVDRDTKGNVVAVEDKHGIRRDKKRSLVNQKGYLLDPTTHDVIENVTQRPMFMAEELDEKGELPAPFCWEKHNFNPHDMMGDFDYQDGKPILMRTTQGFFVDKRARRVNQHGWFSPVGKGHIVDKNGRKRFDKRQMQGEDIHKLYNYAGRKFDIKDVMGTLDRDVNGNIQPQSTGDQHRDTVGRLVNTKGYLIDSNGNVIDVEGRIIWDVSALKNGEFPKIFPFTKFNLARIQGDITEIGKATVDKKGRLINTAGFLTDKQGNVVDTRGRIVFDKVVLQANGDIPEVFKTGLLKTDSASSLSRLMSEIERNDNNVASQAPINKDDGDTSLDSQMEDTPANYNLANQRVDMGGNVLADEEHPEHMASISADSEDENPLRSKQTKKLRKKKTTKLSTVEYLQPTQKEKVMANAYGGIARGELRRPGIKYEAKRLEGSKKFRVSTAEEPKLRHQLTQLAKTAGAQGFNVDKSGSPSRQSSIVGGGSKMKNSLDRSSSQSKSKFARKRTVKTQGGGTGRNRAPMNQTEFENVFGKDIDQFLEESDWDIEPQQQQQQQSSKLRTLENKYAHSTTTGK